MRDLLSLLLPCACLGLLLVACDSQVKLHGRLTGANGQSVSVGEVRIECPELCIFAVAEADGRFVEAKIGRGCPLNCRLRVRSAGYRDFEDSAAKYCRAMAGPVCNDFEANIALEPVP